MKTFFAVAILSVLCASSAFAHTWFPVDPARMTQEEQRAGGIKYGIKCGFPDGLTYARSGKLPPKDDEVRILATKAADFINFPTEKTIRASFVDAYIGAFFEGFTTLCR